MRRLNLRSLQFADRSEVERRLPVEVEPFSFGGEAYTVGDGVDLDLLASRVGGQLALRGTATATVRGPCQRCLGEAVVEVPISAEDYVAHGGSEGVEETEAYVAGDVLDLERWVRDALADALPAQILCRPDCLGLCAVCGADLNEVGAAHRH